MPLVVGLVLSAHEQGTTLVSHLHFADFEFLKKSNHFIATCCRRTQLNAHRIKSRPMSCAVLLIRVIMKKRKNFDSDYLYLFELIFFVPINTHLYKLHTARYSSTSYSFFLVLVRGRFCISI